MNRSVLDSASYEDARVYKQDPARRQASARTMDRSWHEKRRKQQTDFRDNEKRRNELSKKTRIFQIRLAQLTHDVEIAKEELKTKTRMYENFVHRPMRTRSQVHSQRERDLMGDMHATEGNVEHRKRLLEEENSRYRKHASEYKYGGHPDTYDRSDPKAWWELQHSDRWLLDDHA